MNELTGVVSVKSSWNYHSCALLNTGGVNCWGNNEYGQLGMACIKRELQLLNESAVSSLEEGLDETLTLHKLGLFVKLGESFKTTNCIENINRQLGRITDRVSRWQNSNQRQRWISTAMMEIEPQLRTVKGYKFLKELRTTMSEFNKNKDPKTLEIKSAS